jgi:hypothetical protein
VEPRWEIKPWKSTKKTMWVLESQALSFLHITFFVSLTYETINVYTLNMFVCGYLKVQICLFLFVGIPKKDAIVPFLGQT